MTFLGISFGQPGTSCWIKSLKGSKQQRTCCAIYSGVKITLGEKVWNVEWWLSHSDVYRRRVIFYQWHAEVWLHRNNKMPHWINVISILLCSHNVRKECKKNSHGHPSVMPSWPHPYMQKTKVIFLSSVHLAREEKNWFPFPSQLTVREGRHFYWEVFSHFLMQMRHLTHLKISYRCVYLCMCVYVCIYEGAPSVCGHTSFTLPPTEAEHGGNFNQGSQRAWWAGRGVCACVCVCAHRWAQVY